MKTVFFFPDPPVKADMDDWIRLGYIVDVEEVKDGLFRVTITVPKR